MQTNAIRVGENALLEYVPDAIIPYAGARFAQRTGIDLAAGAGLFWWEVIAPGREASGEVFAYESIEMRTDVTANGRLIAAENIRLDPRGSTLRSIARLGEYRYWATFYICRVGLDATAWLAAEEHLREAAREFSQPGDDALGRQHTGGRRADRARARRSWPRRARWACTRSGVPPSYGCTVARPCRPAR